MTEILPDFTDEQTDLRDMAARVARDRYAPHAQEWDDAREHLPDEERRRLGDLGLLGIALPEEYGGGGRPLIDALIVLEELAKGAPQAAWPGFEASTGPARVVHLFGTDELKERLLPPIAEGE
jgi:alkylation response protein AidB-like acyl-CoA dehydrogenase